MFASVQTVLRICTLLTLFLHSCTVDNSIPSNVCVSYMRGSSSGCVSQRASGVPPTRCLRADAGRARGNHALDYGECARPAAACTHYEAAPASPGARLTCDTMPPGDGLHAAAAAQRAAQVLVAEAGVHGRVHHGHQPQQRCAPYPVRPTLTLPTRAAPCRRCPVRPARIMPFMLQQGS